MAGVLGLRRCTYYMVALSAVSELVTNPHCCLHERPVFPPRGSNRSYAYAAFKTLQAHAARTKQFRNGLIAAVRRKMHQRQLWAVCDDLNWSVAPLHHAMDEKLAGDTPHPDQ